MLEGGRGGRLEGGLSSGVLVNQPYLWPVFDMRGWCLVGIKCFGKYPILVQGRDDKELDRVWCKDDERDEFEEHL